MTEWGSVPSERMDRTMSPTALNRLRADVYSQSPTLDPWRGGKFHSLASMSLLAGGWRPRFGGYPPNMKIDIWRNRRCHRNVRQLRKIRHENTVLRLTRAGPYQSVNAFHTGAAPEPNAQWRSET